MINNQSMKECVKMKSDLARKGARVVRLLCVLVGALFFHAYGNAITAVRSNEAYMVSEDGTSSRECIPRERLYRAQTPQTFYLDDLTEAFREATRKGMCDSQSLYTFMSDVFPGRALHIAPGSELNFKLTVPEDFDTLEAILSYRHIRRRER